MPVIAGLDIPKSAPNKQQAEALIEYMLKPETQVKTLQQVAFFPVLTNTSGGELDPGIKLEADAVTATQQAEDAVAALLPVGIGDKGGELNKAYRDAFTRIVQQNQDIDMVLTEQAAALQAVLDATKAKCWAPDPPSDGPCKVG